MDAKVEKQKKSKIKLTIIVSPVEMIKYFDHAYSHLAPEVKLAGFRPGKAPRALIEESIGITRILNDALDLAINDSYAKTLEEQKLNPLASPNVKINKFPTYGQSEEEIKNALEYEAELTVVPDVILGDYSKIKVEKPKAEDVKQEDVEKVLDNLRKQKSAFKDIDREAKKGDFAEINFEGSLRGVRIDEMSSKNHPLVIGDGSLIPGFEDQIVGMKKGETKKFKIKFPKDYQKKDYAGEEAEFSVELVSLKEVILPEIDKPFAEAFGAKDKEDLSNKIEANLKEEMEKNAEQELEVNIINKLLPLIKADIPDEMIDQEVERILDGYKKQLQGMGVNFDSYIASTGKKEEDLRKEMRPTAEKNAKVGLMLGKIIEEQKIDHHDPDAGKKAVEYLVKTLVK